jgi:hypothetical protein
VGALAHRPVYHSGVAKTAAPAAPAAYLDGSPVVCCLDEGNYRSGYRRRQPGYDLSFYNGAGFGDEGGNAFKNAVCLVFHFIQAGHVDAGYFSHLPQQSFLELLFINLEVLIVYQLGRFLASPITKNDKSAIGGVQASWLGDHCGWLSVSRKQTVYGEVQHISMLVISCFHENPTIRIIQDAAFDALERDASFLDGVCHIYPRGENLSACTFPLS